MKMEVDSLNNTLSSKQTPHRLGIQKSRKKKAQKITVKLAIKSKTIKKGEDYQIKRERKLKKLSKKKKGLKAAVNPTMAPKKMSKKEKKKLGKSLWESTQYINKEDLDDSDFEDMSDDSSDEVDDNNKMEEKKE